MDNNGVQIRREAKLSEPFWYYEECKKNWGLPKNAYLSAVKCQLYKASKG